MLVYNNKHTEDILTKTNVNTHTLLLLINNFKFIYFQSIRFIWHNQLNLTNAAYAQAYIHIQYIVQYIIIIILLCYIHVYIYIHL